jgi:nitroreductase
MNRCDAYASRFGGKDTCLLMAYDAIEEYIRFHRSKDYEGEAFQAVCRRFEGLTWGGDHEGKYGGTLLVDTAPELTVDQLQAFMASRHSVRDFTGEPVSDEEIKRAIQAAQLAPSACNRQAVRAYALSSERILKLYGGKMEGIGGFAQDADKFILITGKVSAYRMGEYDQHIVSAAIFASYLTLALHAQGIGSCVVQRPLQYSGQWQYMSRQCAIAQDEQLVLMIAIGKTKAQYTAPVSKRFPVEAVLNFVEG